MNTNFALLARFGTPTIPLKDICEEFFGVKPKTAEAMAKAATLPIPVFKLRHNDDGKGIERSPSLISINELASHIDKMHAEAKQEWKTANLVNY